MRLRLRWKLLLWVGIPAAAVALVVVSLLLSDTTPEELARVTADARVGPMWAVVILAGVFAGLLLGMGVYLERRLTRVIRAVNRLGAGNFTTRVESGIVSDELGELGVRTVLRPRR